MRVLEDKEKPRSECRNDAAHSIGLKVSARGPNSRTWHIVFESTDGGAQGAHHNASSVLSTRDIM